MTRHLITIIISLTLLIRCGNQTAEHYKNPDVMKKVDSTKYKLADSTRKEMLNTLIETYKQNGDSDAVRHAEDFVNKFEEMQKEHGDSITYMSDIFVQFKNSKAKQ